MGRKDMKRRTIAALALAALIVTAFAGPVTAAKTKKKSGPVVVGTDEAGDWGDDPQQALIGDALGQDLVEASIAMADKTTVNFVIKLNSLPPSGGVPEFTRYTWDFLVDGETTELDGKFTNYSRGACDPTSGQCPPPRDPGMQPFLVRGDCVTDGSVTTCQEKGLVNATFDAASATITIPVPLDLLGATAGSKIAPGTGTFGGTVAAVPSAFLSANNFPLDSLTATKTFTVPKK
jgi:hypothetical protein